MSKRYPLIKKMAEWMHKREMIRELRDENHEPPYTKDPVLAKYRFCNVRREDDRVTRWIERHWRTPNADDPMLWHQMMVARFINWPPALEVLGYRKSWNTAAIKKKMTKYRDAGNKVFTGAYIVSTNGIRTDKLSYILDVFNVARKEGKIIKHGMTLQEAHKRLVEINGCGSFMAGQIVADLKHAPVLMEANDWWDWCAPGPGSIRGLNRVMGLELKTRWKPDDFVAELVNLRNEVFKDKRLAGTELICLQDLQNCLCETDKYLRLQAGGRTRNNYKTHAEFYDI